MTPKSPYRLALAAAAALMLPMAAFAEAPKPAGLTEAQVEGVVKKWIEEHPDLVIQSLNKFVAQENARKAEAKNAQALGVMSEIFDAKDQPFVGNPNARITMVYVLDGACGYCKVMTPVMEDIVARNPDLRIVHRWVNFLGPASEYAARAVFVVWKRQPARYADLYRDLMTQKGQLSNEAVDRALAKALGEDVALQVRAEVTSGASRKEVEAQLGDNVALTHRAAVEGTPTLFVPGIGAEGILRGAQKPPEMQAALEKARAVLAKP